MEFKVEASRRNKKFVEALLPSIIKQLNLDNSKTILVVRVADECGDNIQGLTVDLTAHINGIMVIVKPSRYLKEIGLTLAHEMVHVKQIAKGKFKQLQGGKNIWAGKAYNKNTKYLDLPWEVEAFSKQELIFRRAMEE
jgi:hypothetical protein